MAYVNARHFTHRPFKYMLVSVEAQTKHIPSMENGQPEINAKMATGNAYTAKTVKFSRVLAKNQLYNLRFRCI